MVGKSSPILHQHKAPTLYSAGGANAPRVDPNTDIRQLSDVGRNSPGTRSRSKGMESTPTQTPQLVERLRPLNPANLTLGAPVPAKALQAGRLLSSNRHMLGDSVGLTTNFANKVFFG